MQGETKVTDSLLADLAPNLSNLRQLYLVGCPKVTHDGVLQTASASTLGLTGLGLEGLSPAFVSLHSYK